MGIFEKHLGKGQEVEINGDKFILKPLTTKSIPDIMKIMKMFSGAKESNDVEGIFKNLNEDGLNSVTKLIDETLKISYPNEPEEELKQFGMKYMMNLLTAIMEINSAENSDHESKKKDKILNHLNKK